MSILPGNARPIQLPYAEGITKARFMSKDHKEEHFQILEGVATRVDPQDSNKPTEQTPVAKLPAPK